MAVESIERHRPMSLSLTAWDDPRVEFSSDQYTHDL